MRSSFSMRDEDAHGAGIGKAAGGDALGQRLEQVYPFRSEFGLDRLGNRVVGDNLVDVVVLGGGVMRDLEDDVEADALGDAVLGTKRADLHQAGVVPYRDPVRWWTDVRCTGPRVRKLEGDRCFVHECRPLGDGDTAPRADLQGRPELQGDLWPGPVGLEPCPDLYLPRRPGSRAIGSKGRSAPSRACVRPPRSAGFDRRRAARGQDWMRRNHRRT